VKLIFLFLISFSLIVNPTIAYSKATKTILEKTEFYEIISCYPKIDSFEEFSLCVDNQTMTSQKLGLLKKKKKREIFDMLAIVNILNEGITEGFIDNKTAYNNWNQFINSNYKKRSSKQKLKKYSMKVIVKIVKIMRVLSIASIMNSDHMIFINQQILKLKKEWNT
tara:strand:+ start:45 stop:542 length:498 start_codon:yes stop_codon:yes gene_type:complete